MTDIGESLSKAAAEIDGNDISSSLTTEQDPAVQGPTATTTTTTTTDERELSYEEKVQIEIENAKDMKISELKMKLMSKGILTSTFCEKQEFVRAYAECMVKEKETSQNKQASSQSNFSGGFSFSTNVGTTNNDATAFTFSNIGNSDQNDDEGDVDGEDVENDMIEKLPLCVRQRVDKLKELNDEREELMKQYLLERARLEAKYHQLSEPLYRKRKDIVCGKLDNEIAKEHEENLLTANDDANLEKGIPQFWVCALNQMPVIGELITEQDVDCLGYLQDITCMDYENGEGFQLDYHFAPNDYFENRILTKSYNVPNLLLADEPILKNVKGSDIQWKPGKCLTYVEVTKEQRGKGKNAGQIRTVTKKERSESFFHFFKPPKMPSIESMDEQDVAKLEVAFDADYDVAQAFRSHIIPKAVMWFTGNAMEKEMEDAMEGMEWPTAADVDDS